jgi:predicted GIY-YIG superfamily endonuclease
MIVNKFNIYILQLIKDKYYIGKTHNVSIRLAQHKNGTGSKWTKLYSPVKLLDHFESTDKFDEDKYTKKYMDLYGIENVRGGSYTQIKLKKYQIKALEMELITANELCFRCGKYGHYAYECVNFYK